MSAAEKKIVFRIVTVLGTMRQRITGTVQSDIAQKLKQGNIFWKIPMKILVNRQLLQPGNRKCRFYVPNKNGWEGVGESTSWWS